MITTQIFDGVYAPVTEYTPLPMTEQMFWSRVGWLQQAMIRADNFEFRLLVVSQVARVDEVTAMMWVLLILGLYFVFL